MEPSIIITTNEFKKNILRENSKNHVFYNIKFYTFENLKKMLFFDYDNNTIAFIMKKYHVNIAIAKMYLENLYFLKDIDHEKVQFLIDLKAQLDNHNLLIYHPSFKDSIKGKRIIVYGYSNLSKEQKLILKEIDADIFYENDLHKSYVPMVYEATNIDQEVEFVCQEIAKLLDREIPLSHIKIIASNEYDSVLTRYLSFYHIPFNNRSTHSFYNTLLARDFLNHYEEYSIDENVLRLSEKYANVSELVRIINLSVEVLDKALRKEFIINDLQNTKLKETVYLEGLELCSLSDSFYDDDYVFLLGFNVSDYPKIKRDIDYLSDEVKDALGLTTSTEVNNDQKTTILNEIRSTKHLVITYKLNGPNGSAYPSMLISELDSRVLPISIDEDISYAKSLSEIKYAIALDNLYKYNMISDNLALYQHNLDIPYFTYDNQFKGIPASMLLAHLNNELTLSYTNMEMYRECAFHYYVSKILHLDIFEETFMTIIGSIMHHILELGLTKEIDIPVEIMKFVKNQDYHLNAKEYFYLEMISEELKKSLNVIKNQMRHSKLNHYLFENNFFVYKDKGDMKVTFKGTIDKVMYNTFHDKEVIAVVDYKTGSTLITLKDLAYGLHLQLPIYLYLLKKSDRFCTASIAGFYVQKVLFNKGNIEFKKTSKEILENNMRLQGFTNSNEVFMELIDDNYQEGKILLNLKFKKDGSLSANSKVLSDTEMDEVITKVDGVIDETIDMILNGEFKINPKVLNKKNIACTYCKFSDLCFKKKQDEVELGGEEVEVDEGTVISN